MPVSELHMRREGEIRSNQARSKALALMQNIIANQNDKGGVSMMVGTISHQKKKDEWERELSFALERFHYAIHWDDPKKFTRIGAPRLTDRNIE